MRLLAAIGVLAIVAVVGAAVFFLGGFYNVGGTAAEPTLVKWALMKVRTASINHYADGAPPATLNEPAKVQAGALQFSERGCAILSRCTWSELGQVLGRASTRPARSQGSCERSHTVPIILGDQERYQHDRDAELCDCRGLGRRYLVDRGFPEEATERLRSGLQVLDRDEAYQSIGSDGEIWPRCANSRGRGLPSTTLHETASLCITANFVALTEIGHLRRSCPALALPLQTFIYNDGTRRDRPMSEITWEGT